MKRVKRAVNGLLIGALLIGFQSAAAGERSGNTGFPPAPQGLRAISQAGGVLLQWKPVAGSDGYRIYWEMERPVSRYSALMDEVSSDCLRYQADDLIPGIFYNFRVSALRSSIEGPMSPQAGAAPLKEARSGPSDSSP